MTLFLLQVLLPKSQTSMYPPSHFEDTKKKAPRIERSQLYKGSAGFRKTARKGSLCEERRKIPTTFTLPLLMSKYTSL